MNTPKVYLLDERAIPLMQARLSRCAEPTPMELLAAREAATAKARQRTARARHVR